MWSTLLQSQGLNVPSSQTIKPILGLKHRFIRSIGTKSRNKHVLAMRQFINDSAQPFIAHDKYMMPTASDQEHQLSRSVIGQIRVSHLFKNAFRSDLFLSPVKTLIRSLPSLRRLVKRAIQKEICQEGATNHLWNSDAA